jgi:hypothetical protein
MPAPGYALFSGRSLEIRGAAGRDANRLTAGQAAREFGRCVGGGVDRRAGHRAFAEMLTALPSLRGRQLVRFLPQYKLQNATIYAIYPSREYLDAKIKTWVAFLRDFVTAALSTEQG